MIKPLFEQFAGYNRWANARIYEAALALPEEALRRPVGVFFGSLFGTLSHLLTADRIWLSRLTGEGEAPKRVDAVLCADMADLTQARIAADARLIAYVAARDEADFEDILAYRTTRGDPHEQRVADILLHVFNHQTHHRGQAHGCCSILTGREPPPLDLLLFQRGAPAPDPEALRARIG
ncbi:DinB family protein [Flavisphingomonas formosensis]|uniref:DinB family protein n=1 Tax=Flavisphingomonas formosensis TaxID=861534 RepID=UPI0012F7A3C8|nr:DinB family protein [Sphingomonas formosensis]